VSDDTRTDPAEKSYVQMVLSSEEVDRAAVAEARKLLQEGSLDTSEAARRAAEAIVNRGV